VSLLTVSADRPYWMIVEVGAEVLRATEKLVAIHPLRTLDAIHVASAQVFAAGVSESDLMFVSADKRQTKAAAVIGLATRYIAQYHSCEDELAARTAACIEVT
jgi:hypothetical protein